MHGSEQVLDSALKLADTGMPVFPCLLDKRPATVHGFKDASADSATVCELWRKYPGPLIGVPTGEVSGFNVLDFDTAKHPEASDWWRDNYGRLPRTRMHRTRSGGFHLLFKHDALIRGTSSKIWRGVDTRGAGNFIVWWPANGLPVIDAPLAAWPDWLLAEFRPKPQPPTVPWVSHFRGDSGWLRGLVRFVVYAVEGERNQKLFWAACRAGEAVRDGKADEGFVVEVLLEAAQHAGLDRRGAQATIRSGMQRS
jgi:hypothetical protein